MTEDITERLREIAAQRAGGVSSEPNFDPELLMVMTEAAEEIERLRRELARSIDMAVDLMEFSRPMPLDKWHEDCGDVLWWQFPVMEPPYAGTPLDSNWPGYHTHWTPLIIPVWDGA